VKKGEKLPDELLDRLQPILAQLLGDPQDIADAVLYAVTQPIRVNVEQIVVRPPKQLNL
jgi:NADP-dependent 3-hydroxy acid dehydrogenase YdfG